MTRPEKMDPLTMVLVSPILTVTTSIIEISLSYREY